MNTKIVGVIAVSLAAAAIAVVFILQHNKGGGRSAAMSDEALEKLTVDYAYQSARQLAKEAVARCGHALAGQETDLTMRIELTKQVMLVKTATFSKNGLSREEAECVRAAFEGQERSPQREGVNYQLPDSEFEVDLHLEFEAPTLSYSDTL